MFDGRLNFTSIRLPRGRRRSQRVPAGRAGAAVIAAAAAVLMLCRPVAAEVPEEAQECFDCHEDDSLEKDLESGEVLSLYVDAALFAGSVHADEGCGGCHDGISLDEHPEEAVIESRGAFAAAAAAACGDCHDRDDLGEKPVHGILLDGAGSPLCTACHGVHGILPVAEWLEGMEGNEYCLMCHSRALEMTLGNGERLSLAVDDGELSASVHLDHACGDCHAGFSREGHPVRLYASRREHTLRAAAACRECHEEKYEQVEGSVHASLRKYGNNAAPVCVDCHGFHSVSPKAAYETLAGVPCRKCHLDIFEAYAGSMHGEARAAGGHLEAPICADCHQAHDVAPASIPGKITAACRGCHPQVDRAHGEWLPNAGLHLEAVACPACHAPAARRGVSLLVYDSRAGRPLYARELADRLGPDAGALLRGGDQGMNALQLWGLLRQLNESGGGVGLEGRLTVSAGADAHRLAARGAALSACETCHESGSAAFSLVYVTLLGDDGIATNYRAGGDLMGSLFSVGPLHDFYALGGSRIRFLDVLLVLAVLGGLAVPMMHMALRFIIRPRAQEERK